MIKNKQEQPYFFKDGQKYHKKYLSGLSDLKVEILLSRNYLLILLTNFEAIVKTETTMKK